MMRGAIATLLLASSLTPVAGVTFRWSSSANTIYVSGPGVTTLTAIRSALPGAPLTETAPGVWLLRANLQLQQGATLWLHGRRIGGDVDELRLKSNNSSSANSFVWLSADGGTNDIRSTRITSWNEAAGKPDTEYARYKRAFLRVRSRLDADGVTPRESRMDIVDSDVGYLGYSGAEAYGLSWKVNGSQSGLFDRVNVYGGIVASHIHHNYYGIYTYGAQGMQVVNNEVNGNVLYGVDPHDDSDDLLIAGNYVHHNGDHGIIASMRCDHLIVRANLSCQNAGHGIMLHRASDHCLIEDNHCWGNGASGIAIMDGRGSILRGNRCEANAASGIRLSVGSADNRIEDNECAANGQYAFDLYKGTDTPRSGDDGRCKRNQFLRNRAHDNLSHGLRLADADDNTLAGNTFAVNAGLLLFERGVRNLLEGNVIPENVTVQTKGNSSTAASTFVRSQPRLRIALDSYSTTTWEGADGRVFDPEESGLATKVTPSGSTLTLTAGAIGGTSEVLTRALCAVPSSGSATVEVTLWNLSGDFTKRWRTKPGATTQVIAYRVGDLIPLVNYSVLRNGSLVGTVNSDDSGTVHFTDQAGTTSMVEYTVRP